jgi:hypothetical protein
MNVLIRNQMRNLAWAILTEGESPEDKAYGDGTDRAFTIVGYAEKLAQLVLDNVTAGVGND